MRKWYDRLVVTAVILVSIGIAFGLDARRHHLEQKALEEFAKAVEFLDLRRTASRRIIPCDTDTDCETKNGGDAP